MEIMTWKLVWRYLSSGQCWRFCLEVSVGAVPKKAKKARNAQKVAGKVLRGKGFGRRVPGGSAKSESGPLNQVIPRKLTCGDICKYVHIIRLVVTALLLIPEDVTMLPPGSWRVVFTLSRWSRKVVFTLSRWSRKVVFTLSHWSRKVAFTLSHWSRKVVFTLSHWSRKVVFTLSHWPRAMCWSTDRNGEEKSKSGGAPFLARFLPVWGPGWGQGQGLG